MTILQSKLKEYPILHTLYIGVFDDEILMKIIEFSICWLKKHWNCLINLPMAIIAIGIARKMAKHIVQATAKKREQRKT